MHDGLLFVCLAVWLWTGVRLRRQELRQRHDEERLRRALIAQDPEESVRVLR